MCIRDSLNLRRRQFQLEQVERRELVARRDARSVFRTNAQCKRSRTLENSVERKVVSNQHDHHRADKRASVTREALKMANVEKFSL